MTDKELRDAAVAELQLTTVGWLKANGTPRYPSGTAPATTHWGKAMKLLGGIGVVAPPPPSTQLGVGWMRWGNGELPPSHVGDYDRVLTSWGGAAAAVAAPVKQALIYMSAISVLETAPVGSFSYGVTAPEARSMGAILMGVDGSELVNVAYATSKLADPANIAYQQRWCQNVEAKLRQHGLDGVFIDDFSRSYTPVSRKVAAKYPGPLNAPIPAWEAASVAWITYVGNYFRSRGFYVVTNSTGYIGGFLDWDTGQSNLDWWGQIWQHVDGLNDEYGQWHQSIANTRGGNGRRLSGPDWYQHWDEWQRLAAFCASKGVDFHTMNYSSDSAQADYVLASMLLETDSGKGTLYWQPSNPPSAIVETWHATYDKLGVLGTPSGAKVKNGSRWQRQFANGLVWVDPVAGTAGII